MSDFQSRPDSGRPPPADDPGTDNPVEALMRHNIDVHRSTHVRFLHNLMLVLLVSIGLAMIARGAYKFFYGSGTLDLVMIVGGVFLAAWGPFARRQIATDTARKTAAAEWQLQQVKDARRRG